MSITAVQAKSAKKTLQDGNGLMLRVDKKGRKYWECRYTFEGKRPTYRLGPWSEEHGPGWAREEHKEKVLTILDTGVDPRCGKEKKITAAVVESISSNGVTFQAAYDEWFKSQSPSWSKKVGDSTEGRFTNYVIPSFGKGHQLIDQISTQDVIAMLRKFEGCDRSTAHLEQRNKTHQQVKQIFGAAMIAEKINHNPAEFSRSLAGLQLAKKGSELAPKKFKMLAKKAPEAWKLLPEFWDRLSGMSDQMEINIKIMILTLSRPSEIRKAKWEEFDFEQRIWFVPAERMKMDREHLVPLSNQVIILLRRLQEITGDCEHLFPKILGRYGKMDDSDSMSDAGVLGAVRRMGKEFPPALRCDLHGFRHMGSSRLHAECSWDSMYIEFALSHADANKIRATYNEYEYLAERTKMLQAYADQIVPAPQLSLAAKSA